MHDTWTRSQKIFLRSYNRIIVRELSNDVNMNHVIDGSWLASGLHLTIAKRVYKNREIPF
jgi:hypothetical protein